MFTTAIATHAIAASPAGGGGGVAGLRRAPLLEHREQRIDDVVVVVRPELPPGLERPLGTVSCRVSLDLL
jgi:hypothetical protein